MEGGQKICPALADEGGKVWRKDAAPWRRTKRLTGGRDRHTAAKGKERKKHAIEMKWGKKEDRCCRSRKM